MTNSYKIRIDESELQLLACLEQSITGYSTDGVADGFPSSVYLSTQSQQLKFTSRSEDLERHFECFGLRISKADEQKDTTNNTVEWDNDGNRVELMLRREGLYSETNINYGTLGSNPSTQKIIAPGHDCSSADAVCYVTAGVCITSLNGEQLLIYTDTFPFRMRVEHDQNNVREVLSKFELLTFDEYRRCI